MSTLKKTIAANYKLANIRKNVVCLLIIENTLMIKQLVYLIKKNKKLFFAFLLFLIATVIKAQVVKTEGFDNNFAGTTWPNKELPFGWSMGRIMPSSDINNTWERVNGANSLFPTPVPAVHGGTGQVRFRSYYCVNATMNPEAGYLVSRSYDLSARGAVTASNLSFWLYRDNTYAYNDEVTLKVNNSNSITGASADLACTTTFTFGIPRNASQAPATPGNAAGWYQYTFQVPAGAAYSTNTLHVFIIVTHNGVGAGGGNVYIDDFSIDTYPSAQTFNSVGLDYQNVTTGSIPSTNNWIIGCRVTMNNEASQCAMGAFQFAHNGCTNPGTDIANSGTGGVKLWWTGGSNVFSLTNAILVGSYAGPAFPVASFNITPVASSFAAYGGGLLNGNNYFWLTYDIAAGATAGDYADADFMSANICAVTQTCGGVGCSLPGSVLIGLAYCTPFYTVGTSGLNGTYTNNDYIKKVICAGDPAYPPGINNDHNDVPLGSLPVGAGYPGDPCITSSTMLNTGTISPFSSHPSDYQNVPVTTVSNMCGSGSSSRTAVFLANGTASYTISIQVGTWFGSNCVGAWIDFNHDGVFNNTMVPAAGGEKICQSGNMNALTWLGPISFQVPNGAVTGYFGQTILRVREVYGNTSMDACSPAYYGETEDYTVTLMPGCSSLYPGWKIWLGYTDDWNLNTNWCGGIPSINDNALIPGKGPAAFNRGAGSYHPVIKSGVLATTRKLVLLNDTVEANAPVAASLRVSDSLSIGVASALNTSALIVDSAYSANAVISNGVNVDISYIPFKGAFRDQKMQLMYKPAELAAQGLLTGDVIDKIIIPIRIRKSTIPYPVTIKMYYAQNGGAYLNFVNIGYSSPVPAAPTNCLAPQLTAPVTVFSGNIDFTSIPLNAAGTKTVALTTPFTYNNTTNPLIVEICYSLPAASLTDGTWQTQTLGYRSVLILSSLAPYPAAFPGCSWTNTVPDGSTALTTKLASDLRPNLTFVYHRVYTKFPIQLETNGTTTGHWMNFGTFVPANSIVEFKGTTNAPISAQLISGTNNTTFDELKINNTGTSNVKQLKAATVNDTLWLTQGRLMLNSKSITIINSGTGGITKTNGGIQSETVAPNYGTVEWAIGTVTGSHVIPFSTSSNVNIPLTYNLISGDVGTVKAATYPTSANNLPFPTGVTNVNDTNNIDNSAYTVDRFWHLEKTGPSGKARIKFTYKNTEAPAPIINGNIRAQSYVTSTNKWKILPYTMTNTVNFPSPSTSEVLVMGVTGSNLNATDWALADASSPLRMSSLMQEEIEIAPNPFTDKITIALNFIPDEDENITLSLFSSIGKLTGETIIPARLLSGNNQMEWNPGNIESGIYFLVIKTKNEVQTKRVVKIGE
jgi:hypothetical protein